MDDVDTIRFPQVLTRVQHAARISELQEEFENPPIPEDRAERLQNDIVYVPTIGSSNPSRATSMLLLTLRGMPSIGDTLSSRGSGRPCCGSPMRLTGCIVRSSGRTL